MLQTNAIGSFSPQASSTEAEKRADRPAASSRTPLDSPALKMLTTGMATGEIASTWVAIEEEEELNPQWFCTDA
jgi:hypothetical protein